MENNTKTIKQQIDELNDSIYNAILEGKFDLIKADDDYISHGWLYIIELHDSGGLKLNICVNHKDKLTYINNGPSILDLPGSSTYYKIKTILEKSTFKKSVKDLECKKKKLEDEIIEINEKIKQYECYKQKF